MERVSGRGWGWYIKTLSGNDTLLNGSHQAGPYITKDLVFGLFPSIAIARSLNPRLTFPVAIDSHSEETSATAIWYNNHLVGSGTRNECRVTGWGGGSSPLLDPESTGSLCVFAFHQQDGKDCDQCRVWLCSSVEEEDELQSRVGAVEPGKPLFLDSSGSLTISAASPGQSPSDPCQPGLTDLPYAWRSAFPEPPDLVAFAVERLPSLSSVSPDHRLIRRRECEFAMFRTIEENIVLPRIRSAFQSVNQFVEYANSVTNRRKARSGVSLELHAKSIFDEQGLEYSYDEVSEGRKRPDFLFPSAKAYRNRRFPTNRLHMLAVKTTCKDRWRQILNEADRVKEKHLLTLQEGVSLNQFREMRSADVTLVVPSGLHRTYHPKVRRHLLSLSAFMQRVAET